MRVGEGAQGAGRGEAWQLGSEPGRALASRARGQGGPAGSDGAGIGASVIGSETSQVSSGGDVPASR